MFQFRRFPAYAYFVQRTLTEYCSAGFPHSVISGSKPMCGSPKLFAACHDLHRLLMPRHSPCALISLTSSERTSYPSLPCKHESSLTPSLLLSESDPLRWAPIRFGASRRSLSSPTRVPFRDPGSQELCRLQIRFIVVLCYPLQNFHKLLCYLSVACSQFLACFTVQFSRCNPGPRPD